MLQGSMGHDSDGKGGSNTFDDSTPSGKIKAFNNYMTGANLKFTADSKDVVNGTYGGDAYVVSERNEQVPSSYNIAGTTYNNFDTNGEVASYIQSLNIDTPQEAKTKVENYAGRVGEHFKYTFTEADDTDYSRSAILDEVFKSYVADTSDDFVSLGGASDGSGPVTIPSTSTESTTETTTSETKTDVITSETTTETTTSSLVPLAANTYDAAVISADTASFSIVDNQGKNGQIKINESGSVSFAVNAGANVTINYKCGSSDAAKSSAVSCAGRSGAVLSGGSEPAVLELANLSAGEYIITATQSGGTTAQLISIVVSYSQDEDGLWGDADGSGTLTANDSAVIILYTLDPLKAGLSDKTIKYCDVDASGSLGSNDAALVLQKTLTQEFTFPVEQN